MTFPTDSLQSVEQQSEHIYNKIRPYLPALAGRIGRTYFLPLLLGVSVGAIVLFLGTRVLPLHYSTAGIISFAINLFVMVQGWRWMEKRTEATALFVAYTRASRERRELKALLANNAADTAALQEQLRLFEDTAVNFVGLMKQEGAKPAPRKQAD